MVRIEWPKRIATNILTDFVQERESIFPDCDAFDLANPWKELVQLLNRWDVSVFHGNPNFSAK